jgi:hypothetical protein
VLVLQIFQTTCDPDPDPHPDPDPDPDNCDHSHTQKIAMNPKLGHDSFFNKNDRFNKLLRRT